MIIEYWKKIGSFAKWLVPFAVAVFLLFGCGPAEKGTVQAAPETYSASADKEAHSPSVKDETAEHPVSADDGQVLQTGEENQADAGETLAEDGSYTSKEDVALYLHQYGRLPDNFITKKEAEAAGWVSSEGNLWEVAPGMSIGGSRFGNYEGALPEKDGRTWYECDINFDGGFRGAERIIYSNDGLIYYTGDHYKTFEELYGDS